MLSYIPFVQIIELFAAIAALVHLRKEKENPWQWFKCFLTFVFLVEFSAYLYGLIHFLINDTKVKNYLFYKINLPVETVFHSWLLFSFTKQYKKLNRYYVSGLILFSALFFFEISQVPFDEYVIKSDLFESLFLLVGCFLYYYYFLKEEHYVEIIKFAPFWIVTGMFFYHFVGFSITIFFEDLAFLNIKKLGIPLRRYVFIILNLIFYGSWVYAFKIRRKQLT